MIQRFILFSLLCLGITLPSIAQRKTDTIHVHFPFNISDIVLKEQQKLDSLQYAEVMDLNKDVLVIGYADYVGTNEYNDTLSRKRAANVENYLLAMGYKKGHIRLVIGKGEIERAGLKDNTKGFAPDRRVDIVLLKHEKTPTVVAKPQPQPKKPIRVVVEQKPEQPAYAQVKKYLDDILTVDLNEVILLNNIYFPANSHYITPDSRSELDRLLSIMKEHDGLKIRIEGHICCVMLFPDAWDEDDKDYNLSVNRAKFIYTYLVENGVEGDRMSYIGFGRSRPVVRLEKREEDAKLNRRVELRILAK